MTITLSLKILFLICNWTKHLPTGMSIPPPAPEIVLLHLINFGLDFVIYEKIIMTSHSLMHLYHTVLLSLYYLLNFIQYCTVRVYFIYGDVLNDFL